MRFPYPVDFREGLFSPFPNEGPLSDAPIYPGFGYPPRPGEDRPGLSAFGRLAKGGNYGKSSVLLYNKDTNEPQAAAVDMINLNGDNMDACQVVVTLHPPRVIPLDFDEARDRPDTQNLTGEQTNAQVSIDDFPGTNKPVVWPALEAVVEFGTGGAGTQVIVDYLNGVTFQVTTSFLRVRAIVTQFEEPDEISGTSAAYYLAAHAGPGFAENHISRTVYVGILDNKKESNILNLPAFAKRAQLVGVRRHDHSPTITAGWIRFFQSPDGTHGVGDFYFSSRTRNQIEIPNGAQYFSVINKSGHHLKMSVVFGLGL
jgi:hypothetical protein